MSEEKLTTRVYTPESGLATPKLLFADIFNGFKEGRFLAKQLFVRDLKASVRTSFIGFGWHLITPFTSALIWIFLNDQNIVRIDNLPLPYPVFAILGTVVWGLFTEAFDKPLQRYNSVKSMMLKLNFPREAVIVLSFYDLLFSLLLKLIVIIPALLLFGYYPSIEWLWALLGIIALMFLGVGLGLIYTPLAMVLSDLQRLKGYVFQALMYLSPVLYPIKESGFLAWCQKLNPISAYVEFIRSSFGDYSFSMQTELLIFCFSSLLFFVLGVVLVRISLSAILERAGA
jgi:lipopolysaccharide transport system permease protein